MNITIIGGGNVGTLLAGEFTKKGNKVIIYTRNKKIWKTKITVFDKDNNKEYTYTPYKITENIKEAVQNANIIFITLPSFASKEFIEKSKEYIKPNTYVGFYPGTGGIEFISKDLIEKGCIIFGTQRIASVVRLKKYGEYVITAGKRKELFLGAIPYNKTKEVSKIVSQLLEMKITPLPNYLSVSLTPSNHILHPSRLYTIFKDYKEGKTYKHIPLFYEDWNNESSKYLIKCDEELHQILNKINIDTTYIIPLLQHYESVDEKSLTNKIHSIKSFKGIETPSLELENGYIPDLSNRYFTEGFPYGLIIIKSFAMICNVKTKTIDKIINWYQLITNKQYIDFKKNVLGPDVKELSLPQLYGINTVLDIEKYYKKR